jgi:hypothetical protein
LTADPRTRRWRLWRGSDAPPSELLTLEELVQTVKAEGPNREDRAQLDLFKTGRQR